MELMARRVTISYSDYDFDRDAVVTAPLASFVVSEEGIESIDLGEEFIPVGMTVVDPGTREDVSFDADPLKWADLLPSAYRAGDYYVTVEDAEVAILDQEITSSPPGAREPQTAEFAALQSVEAHF